MNTYSLESFINFCDDMQIAEESAHQIKSVFKKEMKQIESLRKEATTVKGDIKKTLECYIKAEEILEQLRSKVNSMDVSTFDKVISGTATIISIATGVGAAIGMNILFKKVLNERKVLNESHAFSSMIVGGTAGGTVWKITKGARNRKYAKQDILYTINNEIEKVKICINVLKNPDKYKKYLPDKDYSDEKLMNAYDSKKVDDIMPLVNKLLKILNNKLQRNLKEIGCDGEFTYKNKYKCIYYTDESTFFDTWPDGPTPNWKKWVDIDELFREIVEDFVSNNRAELKKLNADIKADNPDDVLTAIIRFND